MNQQRIWLILYLLLSLAFIVADFQAMQGLMYITKPLLMTVLAIYFYVSVAGRLDAFCRYILLALFFSMAGDTFLLFAGEPDGQHYFMLGLGSFLFTHICYIIAFAKMQKGAGWLYKKPLWALPFLGILLFNTFYLWPDIPAALRVPVAIYSLTIMAMALAVLHLNQQIPKAAFTLLLTGAILFIFSDSMIALNKFKSAQLNIPEPRLLIMVPYLLGQYFIVKGSIKYLNLSR